MAEYQTLVALCADATSRYADRDLFGTRVDGQWTWTTYAAFGAWVDQIRAGLAARGIGPGDRVALVSDNRVEWAVTAYATYGRGAQIVPMYEAQSPEAWRFILEDCGAKLVVGSRPDVVVGLRSLADTIPSLDHVIGFDLPEDDPDSFAVLGAVGAEAPVAVVVPDPEDLAGLIYTSGTTGDPKGVKLSHRNLCSNINALRSCFTFAPDDRSLSFLPWAHSFGQTVELHALLSMGSSMALNDEIHNLASNLLEVRPTLFFAVPRIFNQIYDNVTKQIAERPTIIQGWFSAGVAAVSRRSAGADLGLFERWQLSLVDRLIFSRARERFGGRLRYAVSGSAALDPEVARFIHALGVEVYEGYGLTETSPIVSANVPGQVRIGSVGKPLPGVRVEIDIDVTDDPDRGEIVIHGPNVMQGYHDREAATLAVLTPDGGLRSGDLGYLDADGFLYITGRIKEQYKLENGKYVVPSPLEATLKLSPWIANVMIHGANRPFNVALVVVDAATARAWAERAGGDLLNDSIRDPRVLEQIEAEIALRGAGFKPYERPRRIALLDEDFTLDNGLLTPTLKLKRRAVLARHGALLEALYED